MVDHANARCLLLIPQPGLHERCTGAAQVLGEKSGAFSSQGASLLWPPDLLLLEDRKRLSLTPFLSVSLV